METGCHGTKPHSVQAGSSAERNRTVVQRQAGGSVETVQLKHSLPVTGSTESSLAFLGVGVVRDAAAPSSLVGSGLCLVATVRLITLFILVRRAWEHSWDFVSFLRLLRQRAVQWAGFNALTLLYAIASSGVPGGSGLLKPRVPRGELAECRGNTDSLRRLAKELGQVAWRLCLHRSDLHDNGAFRPGPTLPICPKTPDSRTQSPGAPPHPLTSLTKARLVPVWLSQYSAL
ncbi:hypothetical protein AAFF_G00082870 [Aldrovandia affinis]|uniref:Uncharacterized protein n=1 Tax=Aldrovandia affinis TaxID=143900 RepID=A0AAD7WCG8_9TELE|nr:hypothetical protein AAFF_G00082870 [Aldrovandia affinis]